MPERLRIAILGASGYTGSELVRLLVGHPAADIRALTADRQAGRMMSEVFGHTHGYELPRLIKITDVDWPHIDVVFCALPHGTTQDVIAALPAGLKVIDLSADFRLHDLAAYHQWYGHEHKAPALQKQAVYGLTEFAREDVRRTSLVANPGCYPTAAGLALVPLVAANLINADDIIIDAKSGVSGAGREAKQQSLHTEVSEGIHAYGIAGHRHVAEIEQMLASVLNHSPVVNFTPHLMPINRGILATVYVRLSPGSDVPDLRQCLEQRYAEEPFVMVLPGGVPPQTRFVRGTNNCHLNVFADRVPGRAIVISAIDNLVKGASGQAVQNMNVLAGLPESTGLSQMALFP